MGEQRKAYVTMGEESHMKLEEISGITKESMTAIVERLIESEYVKVFNDPAVKEVLEELKALASQRNQLETELRKLMDSQKELLSRLQPKN